ncbi:hypothetical protein, partial [Thermoflexus sp.]|uniref:hypothetical protein n=1 Tax=Thermoflexus sp. TaxID=1969742 RepID=UPI002ADE3CBE
MNTTRGAQARGLWMRAVPFTALRALLFFAAQHPEGLRAKDLDAIAGQLRTSAGKPPARTTRYHYRNVLLGLKILERRGERYFVRRNDPLVEDLLLALRPEEPELTLEERRCFAELVLRNPDCQEHFFSLFADGEPLTDLERFVAQGQPVAWRVLPKSSKAVPESSPETS